MKQIHYGQFQITNVRSLGADIRRNVQSVNTGDAIPKWYPWSTKVMNHKESWVLRHWCFWIVVLEKTLESLFESKEIKTINPNGNHLWIYIGRTEAEAQVTILWPPDAKRQLIEKTPILGKIEGRRRRGWKRMRWLDDITNSMDMSLRKLQEMVKHKGAWCCSSWDCKDLDRT